MEGDQKVFFPDGRKRDPDMYGTTISSKVSKIGAMPSILGGEFLSLSWSSQVCSSPSSTATIPSYLSAPPPLPSSSSIAGALSGNALHTSAPSPAPDHWVIGRIEEENLNFVGIFPYVRVLKRTLEKACNFWPAPPHQKKGYRISNSYLPSLYFHPSIWVAACPTFFPSKK